MVRGGVGAVGVLLAVLLRVGSAEAEPAGGHRQPVVAAVPETGSVEGSAFEALVDRYERVVELFRHLEEEELSVFEQRATRYAQLVAFTRRLETEHEAEEAREFEESVSRSLRARAFLRQLVERQRHEKTEVPPCLAEEPADWYTAPKNGLYSRE